MNILQKTIAKIDRWQRRHKFTAFPYAVIKKYGEDEAGHQAALLTYYGFLSLFPLLLVITTLLTIFGGQNEELRNAVANATADYFPTFSQQLTNSVEGIDKNGIQLVIGILFTLYGARGVADAFRKGVNHIWQTPRAERDGFPLSLGKSLAIIIVGGLGFLTASVSSGIASAVGRGFPFVLLAIAVNIFILFWLFKFLLNFSLPSKVPNRHMRAGAISAAVGLVILQLSGNFILGRQLGNLDAVSSYFALVLGLLFWIYLQAQVVFYSVEIASVRSLNLYPRGIRKEDLTEADKRAYSRQASREQQVEKETITTRFRKK